MKTGVFRTKDQLKTVLASITSIPTREVLVGIPGETTGRKDDDAQPVDVTNAMLGFIHEFGAPEHNIPARPFLYPGVRMAKDRVASYFKQAGQYALKGDKEGVTRALHAAGTAAMNSVRRKINIGPFEPLKESTLAARRARGRTGTRPLIDTGQLRDAITYVIRDAKKTFGGGLR